MTNLRQFFPHSAQVECQLFVTQGAKVGSTHFARSDAPEIKGFPNLLAFETSIT
jgi:hypothetical protein